MPAWSAAVLLTCLLVGGVRTPAAHAQGATLDSVVALLRSPDFNDRQLALQRIIKSHSDPMPGQLAGPVLALLDQEAARRDQLVGEDIGEYLIDLFTAAVLTRDPRATTSLLRLDAIEASSAVGDFVASQGPAVLPALAGYATAPGMGALNATTVYAMMLARYGQTLGRADSATVLARLLGAAAGPSRLVHDEVARDAAKIPLPEFLPVVQALVRADRTLLAAPRAERTLTPLYTSAAPSTLLRRLAVTAEGVCAGASALRAGACAALRDSLVAAARHLGAGAAGPAQQALRSVQATADLAAAAGTFSPMEKALFSGNAALLLPRVRLRYPGSS